MKKRIMILSLVLLLVLSIFAGCGSKEATPEVKEEKTEQSENAPAQSNKEEQTEKTEEAEAEVPIIEWYHGDERGYECPADGLVSKFYQEEVGVGIYHPGVLWDGGTGYYEKLQLRIASGEIPDLFLTVNGIETTLAADGALADLKPYLEEYAPNIYASVDEETWAKIAATDPNGEGAIYYIPEAKNFYSYGTFIRQDWLDNLGLSMPTTQEEFVEVLKAFRDNDPNGNGQKDEIPTIGRALGRWFDYIFNMYNVSMFEGYPQFDLYNGELTYSGVTQNMRDALVFANMLYEEELLDPDTFLNESSDLWNKVNSDRVGVWFHIPLGAKSMCLDSLLAVNPNAKLSILPDISAPGYEFQGGMKVITPRWLIANKDEQTIINCLKVLDHMYNPANMEQLAWGIEGVTYTEENGVRTKLPFDQWSEGAYLMNPLTYEAVQYQNKQAMDVATDEMQINAFEQVAKVMEENQNTSYHLFASDGMSNAVYEGYPDIQNHTLYQEYITKIIIGTFEIEKFDEFVELWYEQGGQTVTERARDWYSTVE